MCVCVCVCVCVCACACVGKKGVEVMVGEKKVVLGSDGRKKEGDERSRKRDVEPEPIKIPKKQIPTFLFFFFLLLFLLLLCNWCFVVFCARHRLFVTI